MDPSASTNLSKFEKLVSRLDVQLGCPDFSPDQKLSRSQKKHDDKISRAVGELSAFFNGLSEDEREVLCVLAGKNRSGKHSPLREWWLSFSGDNRVTCHNELARQGKDLVDIMKKNLKG